MKTKKILTFILTLSMVLTILSAFTTTATSAVETVPTIADIANPGFWPSQPMTVANDGTNGVKITFGASMPWGIRAVGQKSYTLSELEISMNNVSMPAAGAGIFMNFADATSNPASDPSTASLMLYIANTATGFDVNLYKRPAGASLGTINFNVAFSGNAIVKFEQLTDGSWLLVFNNKSCAITQADMNIMIADQTKACFSVGNNNTVASPTSLDIGRIRNVPARTDLKPTAANFVNPYWGAMVAIANDAVNGTSVTFPASTPWGPRAIGQDVFKLSDLEIALSNFSMTNSGAGIFLNIADYTTNPASDPAATSLFFYIKNSVTGYDVELIQRPGGTSLATANFTGTIPSAMKFGFIKNIDGSWFVRINDRIIAVTEATMDALIANKDQVCFSIGNNNNVPNATSFNINSIRSLSAQSATPTPTNGTATPTPTVTNGAVTPTPFPNTGANAPVEGDFVNPGFWSSSLIQVTPLGQQNGIQVVFPGTSAWGVRAIGAQEYVLDGLEMDLTSFVLGGANRQFIMMIADSKINEASDPSSKGILLVYSIDPVTLLPQIALWARPFYTGDEPLAIYTMQHDIVNQVRFKFVKNGANWDFTVNGETFSITDTLLKTSIPNPAKVRFAPGFGAANSAGLSFIIKRVTNKVGEIAAPTAIPTTSGNGTPATGDNGNIWMIAMMLMAAATGIVMIRTKNTAKS